ncbi:hypothetical protein IC229_34350 [Spirosoma sp. BT702]|uniref:Bacterial bifunctional deaminase-reductase C-terminal domain-containing protein n=1 Tax=Spirosoma profusum TaxID=2771354 RepID=A0A927AWM9_9BACT|nr:hypothetical protein [Spirosoma profusum]MBD2705739.1 hypothetical protein [Spirosoma profusum]
MVHFRLTIYSQICDRGCRQCLGQTGRWGSCRRGIGGAGIAEQCKELGLLDEIQIHLLPVLLATNFDLFEHLGSEPMSLKQLRVVETVGVTHLWYQIIN